MQPSIWGRWPFAAAPSTALFVLLSGASTVQAQQPKLGELYKCTDGRTSLKVTQCSGGNPSLCDIEGFADGKPQPGMRVPSAVVNDLLRLCLAGAPSTPNAASPSAGAQPGGVDANGFKIGDIVSVNTAFGWMDAKILKANGDSYYVHAKSGAEVWKPYPSELRRIGPINDIDRAHGLYALHDRVKVNVEGRWEDGEVITEMGRDYQVALAGNRTAWAAPEQLRFVAAQQKTSVPAASQPPQPGMTSCAGKIEGRYTGGAPGGAVTITFRSGKATMRDMGGEQVLECWTAGDKIVLREAGKPENDMPIDVNDDGTLQAPLWGELKKKGN
jgi:hypothetical protein